MSDVDFNGCSKLAIKMINVLWKLKLKFDNVIEINYIIMYYKKIIMHVLCKYSFV
jgi:hypothetical protein